MTVKHYVLIGFVVAAMLLAGCLTGPLPEDTPKTPFPETQTPPPLPLEALTYVSFDPLTYSVDPDFADIIPKFPGLVFLPSNNPVDVVSNDLSVLNHSRRLQILASIAGKTSGVYVQPRRDSNQLIYLTIYRLNDTGTALDLLDAYKGAWNKRLLNVSGAEIWIWDGYLDEIADKARPLAKDMIVYWDAQSQATYVSNKVLPNTPALTKTETDLYSVHGETAFENYFIMIDIKTELDDIQNQTDRLFTEAAGQIFNVTPASGLLENSVKSVETPDIKEELRLLLESYLAGNITKDEYNRAFENYNTNSS